MGFWKKQVVEFALDHETRRHIAEQRDWIAREPANPHPYANLAQLYRMENRQDEALGLLLEAVRLDADFAPAHGSLAEIYAIRGDYPAAWRHARQAQRNGDPRPIEMLQRHGILEID
jgi:cytochrome c-type biogenesis protein CcmH/NrfG